MEYLTNRLNVMSVMWPHLKGKVKESLYFQKISWPNLTHFSVSKKFRDPTKPIFRFQKFTFLSFRTLSQYLQRPSRENPDMLQCCSAIGVGASNIRC